MRANAERLRDAKVIISTNSRVQTKTYIRIVDQARAAGLRILC